MSNAERFADWKVRHPDKAIALEKAVARMLGMRRGITSDLARGAVDRWMVGVLTPLLNWAEEPEIEQEMTPSVARAEARKILDLEDHQPTGRDKAAGKDV